MGVDSLVAATERLLEVAPCVVSHGMGFPRSLFLFYEIRKHEQDTAWRPWVQYRMERSALVLNLSRAR